MSTNNQIIILEAVTQCNYPSNVKDYVANMICEMLSMNKTCKFFKINKMSSTSVNELIIGLKMSIQVMFNGRKYDIPIQILIPKSFPFIAPEIYIEKMGNEVDVNPNNKNIDPSNGRIMTKGLITWNSYSSLQNVLAEVNNSFNEVFPIYQKKKIDVQVAQDMSGKAGGVGYQSGQQGSQGSQQGFQQVSQRRESSNIINITQQNDPISQIKFELIETIKMSIIKPLHEEIWRLNQETNNLQSYKQEFQTKIQKYNDLQLNKNNAFKYLENTISNLNTEFNTIKESVDKLNNDIITKDNVMSFIQLHDENIIKLVTIEATLEDTISIVKRAFERQIMNFSNTVKFIRIITREIIKVRTVRDKAINNIKKV